MKPIFVLMAVALLGLLAAAPAGAYLDSVIVPPEVIATESFTIVVNGSHSDPCWDVVDVTHVIVGSVLTLDVFTEYVAPPGTICPTVLEPYEVIQDLAVPTEGAWLLRVVEHRPDWPPIIWDTIEVPFTANAPVAVRKIAWGTLRAHYR